MNANASAVVRYDGVIVCSRCGSKMSAEQLWHEDNRRVPMILWRCAAWGHITQAAPLPPYVYDIPPRLSQRREAG